MIFEVTDEQIERLNEAARSWRNFSDSSVIVPAILDWRCLIISQYLDRDKAFQSRQSPYRFFGIKNSIGYFDGGM